MEAWRFDGILLGFGEKRKWEFEVVVKQERRQLKTFLGVWV
jgi:hypothetical protein